MTDLTERLDRHLLNDDAEQRWLNSDSLIEEALDEIRRLRVLLAKNDFRRPKPRGTQ